MSTGTVTVLFTDLVDSTALLSALGEDAAEEVRRAHFGALREAIAETGGEEIKNLGDGLMVVFPSVSDSVRCAIAMQQEIDRHNRRASGPALSIRVGVSVGDATREENDFFGTPVVEAARLCAASSGGQILTTDLVRAMVGTRGGHELRPVGELALKGLPDPVPAWEVVWQPVEDQTESDVIPLPNRLTIHSRAGFFGRVTERDVVDRAWKEVVTGQRRVVLLAGEPGIGKTRLASEVAAAAHENGATVLYGRCEEEIAVPYQPFAEALRHYVQHCDEKVLQEHVDLHGGDVARLVPEMARRVPDVPTPPPADPDTERYRLFAAVTALLSAQAERSPTILVLDDLHWAAKPTLLMLRQLISIEPAGLLVIGTYRDTDLPARHPLLELLADLRREPGVDRLLLRGLSDGEVLAFMESAAGHALGDDGVALAHALHDETQGSPFFVTEILRHLAETGAIFLEDGRWTYRGSIADLGIPESVREVIGRRLTRLSEAANQALTLGAVIGREFDLALLERVSDAETDDLLEALEEATSMTLLAEVDGTPGRFTFPHALIRHTLYEDLGAARRVRVHRRIAEAIEALVGDDAGPWLPELAHHWLQATQPADSAKAVNYAHRAGDQALAGLAYEEAAEHYEHALGVLEPHERAEHETRCDLLLALADARRRGGDERYRDAAIDAATAARRLGDGERLAAAALRSSRLYYFTQVGVVDEELTALCDEALSVLPDADSVSRPLLLSQLALQLIWGPERDRRYAIADEALAMARRLDDPGTLAQVLSERHIVVWGPGTLVERLEIVAELRSIAQRIERRELEFQSWFFEAIDRWEALEPDRMEEPLARCRALADEMRQPFFRWVLMLLETAQLAARNGDSAEEAALDAFQVGQRPGGPDALNAFGAALFSMRERQGRLEEFVGVVQQAADDNPGIPGWRAALAFAHADAGRHDDARRELAGFAKDRYACASDYLWHISMWLLAGAAVRLGDRDVAAVLYDRLLPERSRMMLTAVAVNCSGSTSGPLGALAALLGRPDDAVEHLEQAIAEDERAGAPVYVPTHRRVLAEVLRERNGAGDHERARALVTEALDEARRLGVGAEIPRLEALGAGLASGA